MKSLTPIHGLALAGCLMATGTLVQAQDHYPPGLEGIGAASLPPAGVYARDYNYFYTADRLRGVGPQPDFNVFVYAQVPRVIWMTDLKPLGINYGMDITVPIIYTDFKVPGYHRSQFGLSDISVEPLLLSKTVGAFDFAAAYAFWAPTGDFDARRPESPGKGYWAHMLTLGTTWHIDSEKSIALSLLDRYEINQEQDQTGLRPGQNNTLEFGLSKGFNKVLDIGLIGFYQQQTTDDRGALASNQRNHIMGLGPEVSMFWSSIGLISSLRYAYEFDAKNRPEGHVVCLTLTRRF